MNADDRYLLLLGMLKTQRSHGYQVHEFIEKNLARVADMKKATAYATLDKLSKEGLVDATSEQVGNRPPRKVYALTTAGEERFVTLLRKRLRAADDARLGSDIAVMFLDDLPETDARKALADRLADRRSQLAMYEAAPTHPLGSGVDLAIEHVRAHLKADCAWLEMALARLGVYKQPA
jgi:DNA-binding PadR family transcriptional regulator